MEAAFSLATSPFFFLAQAEGTEEASFEHMHPMLPGTVRVPEPVLLLGPGREKVLVANEIAASTKKDTCGCSERHPFSWRLLFR